MQIVVENKRVGHIPVLEFYNPEATGKLPMILIFHGFNGSKEHHIADGYQLARQGYYAVSLDAHLHGELGERPFVPSNVVPRMWEVIQETADFINPLIDHYCASPPADASRVGLMGISMGGAIIFEYLPHRRAEIKTAVCLIAGIPCLWQIVLENCKPLYPEFRITDEQVAAVLPSGMLPFLPGVSDFPILMQYGEADPLIPVGDVRLLHAQTVQNYSDENKLTLLTYPGVGHEVTAEMAARGLAWFNEYL